MKESRPILIVEDDQDVRESLQMALEAYDFSVITAPEGKSALELLRNGLRPCVILADVMMPVMNGWDFLEAKLNDPALRDIPIYMLSAADRNHALADRANGFFAKPIKFEKLLEVLARYCRTDG